MFTDKASKGGSLMSNAHSLQDPRKLLFSMHADIAQSLCFEKAGSKDDRQQVPRQRALAAWASCPKRHSASREMTRVCDMPHGRAQTVDRSNPPLHAGLVPLHCAGAPAQPALIPPGY